MGAALVLVATGCSAGAGRSSRKVVGEPHAPGGIWYTVRQGESLTQLARRFAIPLADLEEINAVDRADPLAEGRRLFLPRTPTARRSTTANPAVTDAGNPSRSTKAPLRRSRGVAPTRLSWPLQGGRISSRFGKRRRGRRHEGLDIAAPGGTPVLAAAAGTVLHAGSKLRGYGKLVLLRHAGDLVTVYAHNRRLLVREGQRVRAGEVIAEVGKTGRATGNHLHFEVRKGDQPVDPLGYVTPP